MDKYAKLFSPCGIAGCRIKNRFAMAPMGPLGLGDSEGGFNQRGVDYYAARAKGGAGLLITGVTLVDTVIEDVVFPNTPCSTYNPIHFMRTARELTERVHAYDAKIFLQMTAGFGRVAIPTNLGEFPPVSASSVPHRWLKDVMCRPLAVSEIQSIVKSFGDGAYNAQRAGFDGVEIHAVHEGYLLDQFAIAFFNARDDAYGGSLENRLRFAVEIVREIKRRCGADFPVCLRYSLKSFVKDYNDGALPGEIFAEKGRDIEEGIEAAKALAGEGYDALDVDVGSYDAWWWSHPPMYQEKGLYREYAKIVKDAVHVPVLCAGRMDEPDMALAAIEDGVCDFIGLGRPLLADPDYVNKLRTGRRRLIRPCLSCQEGCMGRIQTYSAINCAVNPQAARETIAPILPTAKPRRVLIAGGGPAGCEAARVLKLRGHVPVLCEKTGNLGGALRVGGVPEFKTDDLALANWYEETLRFLDVDVRLHTEVSADDAQGYDAVVVATGGKPKRISVGDDARVHTAEDVLRGVKPAGARTCILGGGLVGCELALWLRRRGAEVAIVEAESTLMPVNKPLCSANWEMLGKLLGRENVRIHTSTRALSFANGSLKLSDGGEILCDSVILAIGYAENRGLYDALSSRVDELYVLGDARKVSNVMYAIWDAFEVANSI
ncbi:MAG: FAD-dependent oxidoreductase [Clostridiales Family XIII bacterium]|jgi:2-enoate reductase|nr:FAD-dependent oxidoreductase [Clostridiales Family XIII bacterium]